MITVDHNFSYGYLLLTFLFFITCQEPNQLNENCVKFINEEYSFQEPDSTLMAEAIQTQKWLLEKFKDTTIQDSNYETYYLQFYSSHGFGSSIKFEKRYSTYWLSKRCILKEEWFEECKEYDVAISAEEWNFLEDLIYEFNFWTDEPFEVTKDVLDGYVYILEGNRPQAKDCDKKSYKLAARGSPQYDKMGALCLYIQEYEDSLASVYRYKKQIN